MSKDFRIPASLPATLRRQSFDAFARESVAPALRTVDLFITINGPGQVLYPDNDVVPFPVRFTELPIIGQSYALNEDGVLALDATVGFPELSVGAHHYDKIEAAPGVFHYVGAQLIVVARGHDGMLMDAHVTFTGRAISNPQGPTGELT